MTKEKFKMAKQRMEEGLPKLKRDFEKLNNIITIFDEFLEKGTPENIGDYSQQVDNIVKSFEVLDL